MAPNFKMMGLTMGLALISNWYLDTSSSVQTWGVRGMYLLSQLVCYGALALIYVRATNNTEEGVVTVKEDVGFGQVGEKDEKITIAEHDTRICFKELTKFGIGSVITMFVHWKWGFFPPLIIQTITQPYNLLQTPIAKVTLLGQRAWGELRRPWQDPSSMGSQWNSWNETINSALTGETTVRSGKKAAKKAARAAKKGGKAK